MKLNIDGFEVEIKAKMTGNDRANKTDTMYFLNKISIWASEAAKHERTEGFITLAESYETAGEIIYDTLEAAGFYKD